MPLKRILLLIAIIVLFVPMLACNTNKEIKNPKLDSVLVQLIQAQKRGEAESFAVQHVIRLDDGKVFVTIWPVSGQGEVVASAIVDNGGEITADYKKQIFDAWVPITQLESLANNKSTWKIEQANPGEASINR